MSDNRESLSKNFVLNGGNGKISIAEEVGRGANCIVYLAAQIDNIGIAHKVLVRECYPAYLLVSRDEQKNLIVGASDSEKFLETKRRFLKAYKKSSDLRNTLGLTNSTVNFIEAIEQNNTLYAVMNFDEGNDYKNYRDKNLKELLAHVKSLAVVIGKYHKNNFLHLDIKPENFLVIPETPEHILLFDFDSIVTIDEIKANPNLISSYSDGFSAPEQIQGNVDKIGFHTDIYSIGAILFSKIFNRKATFDDGKIYSRYDFAKMNFFDKRYPPKLFRELDLFFRKTIAISTFARYGEIESVVKILDELIELADVERVFPIDNFQSNTANFIGRTSELCAIQKILQDNQLVFLSGIGGIGKTELAKKFAAVNRGTFDTIIFCRYESSIAELVTNQISINGIEQDADESTENFFHRKLSILRETLTPNDLIILDNFDSDEDTELENLFACPCKFLITTRLDFSDYNFPQIEVRQIENLEEVTELFKTYNGNDYDNAEQDATQKIFQLIDCHTMTVELTAKYLRETGESPQILLERFQEVEGITNVDGTKIRQRKDFRLRSIGVTDHLRTLFNLSNFDAAELEIMRSLSLLGGVRISKNYFREMLRLENFDALDALIKRGWIESDDEKISLHQIILDLAYSDLKPSAENCPRITDSVIAELKKKPVNWTSERIKNQMATTFIQRASGKNLQYADLCVSYGDEKYLADVEKICLASRELFAYDVLQRFYRLKIKFSAQMHFYEGEPLSEECRKNLSDMEKYFDLAKTYCAAYSKDAGYLAKNFCALAFETDEAINSEIVYTADDEFSLELNRLYEKIFQVVEMAAENLATAENLSNEEKISLFGKIRDFYSDDDFTAFYRTDRYFDPEKQEFYQTQIDNLRQGKGAEIYTSDVHFYDLALECEINGDWDRAINFYQKSYDAGEEAYDLNLYATARVCLQAGYVQQAIENLQELLRLDRENPQFPFSCRACLKLIDIFIDEKNFDEARKLIYELIEKSSDETDTYQVTYLVAAYFRLYAIDSDSKFWRQAVKYFRLLDGEEEISDALNEFAVEYALHLTDSEKDLAELERLTRRIGRYPEESLKKIFEHAIEVSKNHAEYHVKFLTEYVLYMSRDLRQPSTYSTWFRKLAHKYLDEVSLEDESLREYLRNYIYRAEVDIAFYSDDVNYQQLKKFKSRCNYFLLTEREVANLDDEKKFQHWRDAAQSYELAGNFQGQLRCLEEAEKISALDFQEYLSLEIEKLNCLAKLGDLDRTKNFAQEVYAELIEKYFSADVSLRDKLNDLADIFEKISCASEVFALNLYEICLLDADADKNFMASLEIKKSAESKILEILESLTDANLDAKQIDFVVERIEKIAQLNFKSDFAKKCSGALNLLRKKFQYAEIEFKASLTKSPTF